MQTRDFTPVAFHVKLETSTWLDVFPDPPLSQEPPRLRDCLWEIEGWVELQTDKTILAEFLHQNFLLGMGGVGLIGNQPYMGIEGRAFYAKIDGLEKVDAIYNYFKRFLSVQQNQCFDTILAKASAHLDLFTRINKVEEAIESHKEWLNSITRDLEVTGLSKQLQIRKSKQSKRWSR